MAGTSSQEASVARTAFLIGFGLWATSLIWCLAYYSAWDNAFFGSLDLKLFCVSGATEECAGAARDIIQPSGWWVPAYSPVLWWLGLGAMIVGIVSRFRQRS